MTISRGFGRGDFQFLGQFPFVLPRNEALVQYEFVGPTIIKLILISLSTSSASTVYNVNLAMDHFQQVLCNWVYSFFNNR